MGNKKYIHKEITIKIDRPLGSRHPKYSFTISDDGEELDAYLLGVCEPVDEYTGTCIAIIKRTNDNDDKLVVVPNGMNYSNQEIDLLTEFQEQYYKHIIFR